MLLKIISVGSFILSTIPALLLFGLLVQRHHVYQIAVVQPYNLESEWILANIQNSNLAETQGCYSESTEVIIAKTGGEFNKWKDASTGIFFQFSFLIIMGCYFSLRFYGGLIENILSKRTEKRLKWLISRLFVIFLNDSIAFKVLHNYRILGFIDIEKCLKSVEGYDFLFDSNNKKLISASNNLLFSFLFSPNWEILQYFFVGICVLYSVLSAFQFTKRENAVNILSKMIDLFFIFMGLFGMTFAFALLTYENGAYYSMISQIKNCMLWRMIIAILETIFQFLWSPNSEYQTIPPEYRLNQIQDRSESKEESRDTIDPANDI